MNTFKIINPSLPQFFEVKNETPVTFIQPNCEPVELHNHRVLHDGEIKMFQSKAHICPVCKALAKFNTNPSLFQRVKNWFKKIFKLGNWIKLRFTLTDDGYATKLV